LADNLPNALKVSVVVPTYNRLERLRRVLDALARQTVDPADFEVIVVSDGSTDGTDEFLRDAATPFRLVGASRANAGPAAARNIGTRLAAGALVLFVDDDVVPRADLLEQHLTTHEQAEAEVVVIGPMLTPPDYLPNAFVRWEQAMLYKQYRAMTAGHYEATHRQFYTGNASLGRDFLLASGGFDERFRRAEDVELAFRLHDRGARFIFNPDAVGYHYAERSFASWIQNARAYGRNEVLFDRYYGRLNRLEGVRREFTQRNALLRAVARTCIGRPRLEAALNLSGRALAGAAERLGLERLVQIGLSTIYQTTYYSGLAEQLGGRRPFNEFITDLRVPESLADAWAPERPVSEGERLPEPELLGAGETACTRAMHPRGIR
jgi:GT2 family glycosyltransferase